MGLVSFDLDAGLDKLGDKLAALIREQADSIKGDGLHIAGTHQVRDDETGRTRTHTFDVRIQLEAKQ